jgi:hypothetical protein
VGLVKGLTPKTLGERIPWYKQPAMVALLALVVLVLLNIYFW